MHYIVLLHTSTRNKYQKIGVDFKTFSSDMLQMKVNINYISHFVVNDNCFNVYYQKSLK